jgi:myo-inositol-1(or 4)-monophosphatase
VSQHKELADCLLGVDMGYVDEKAVVALKLVQGLWGRFQGMRTMGSSALGLAYVAAGRLDLYIHHHLYPWDIASGLLLVAEAGGLVMDKHGDPATLESQSIIASSPLLVKEFLQVTEGSEWRR